MSPIAHTRSDKCTPLITGRVALLVLLACMATPQALARQICTTAAIDNDDFQGIDGSSDTNVIAVGKKGHIARFDGVTWTQLVSPSNEELLDVHVINAGEAFAVGKKGEILQQNGAVWTTFPGVTNEDLRGVWAASASEAWVVGKKGVIFSYDGSAWTDQSAAAGASNKDMEDAWGDASSFYALNDQGVVYRYDRTSDTWDAPDTLCSVANGFEDLWGDDSGNLFLVRKKEIYVHNGSTCTLLANADEDLRGVSGSTVTGEVYAVGKKGTVMYYNGATWRERQEGNEELRDDWVSAAGNAYYAGKKGELTTCLRIVPQVVGDWPLDDCTLDLPGSTVTDASGNGLDGITAGDVALESAGQLCAAAELDGSSGYVAISDAPALDLTEGVSFAIWVRHDASALSDWDAVITKGESAYRLHLNGGCSIADNLPGNSRLGFTFGLNGGCGGADLNSNVVPVAGAWYHVAGTYDRERMHIYINGQPVNWADYSAAIGTNNFDLAIGENSQNRGRYWDGDIDEFTLWDEALTAKEVRDHRDRTRPCVTCSVPQFNITHDNFGIHCLDEPVRIDVVDSLAGTPRIDYDADITLDTGSGSGTWLLIEGGGVLVEATPGDGIATYDWPLGESYAVFALDYPDGTPSIDIDVYQNNNPSISDLDVEGNLVFSSSGFTVTAAPLSNPPPAIIAPFGGPRIAGVDMPAYLTAYGQTPGDPQCGVIETYGGTRNLKFWSSYLNPGTGSVAVGIDGLAIASNQAASTVQPVAFVNGQAAVVAKYKDVGLIQILLKDDTVAHPDLPGGIRGATASFVVKPDRFELSAIEDATGTPNPGAAGAGGPIFVAAGEPFFVTVTALDAEDDPTPNYGRETIAETVSLTPTLVAPAAGANPPLAFASGFGAFAGGSATGTDFLWPEVGVITLTPSVGDGDYLTGGDVTGTASGNVGRFVPAYFDAALNAPAFTTACAGGGFTYLGQVFDYAVAPQITLTARSAAATVTQNYSGAFFKITNTSLLNRSYGAAVGTLNVAGLPSPAVDPAIADLGSGVATLTFSAGSGFSFARTALTSPFDADIQLSIDAFDSDAVAAAANPLVFGGAGGITFDAGPQMRYGRARLANAVGSELINLALPLTTEYFVGGATGFITNTDDTCTAAMPLAFSAYAGNISAGDTCVLDAGNPGASLIGCAAAAPMAERYRNPSLGGNFNLSLAAPGGTNDGSVSVTADAPAWLRFDWDGAAAGEENPTGTATFGVFPGNARRIYQREVY